MRYLYSLLFYLILPGIFLRLGWKGRKNPAYRDKNGWKERLGFFKPPPAGPTIWVHAVSVGEMIAARPLIQRLKHQYPKKNIVITTMTPTGLNLARDLQDNRTSAYYVPYDIPLAINRFLNHIQPQLLIIMETELWPNLIYCTAKRQIPIILANARLSVRSARGYRRIANFTKSMLQHINLIIAQSKSDAERFIALGANSQHMKVTGSIKFDVPIPDELVKAGRALRKTWPANRAVLIAASTHAGEEEKVLTAFRALKKTYPNLLLILVPRHLDRFEEVAVLCKTLGFATVRRSHQHACQPDTDIFLGDTLGELFFYYAAADIVFLGGSFAAIGGHNFLEPAALGLPIITGPELFNFIEIFNLLDQAQAIIKINHSTELPAIVTHLLNDPAKRAKMGHNARVVVEENRGALNKHIDYISLVLP